MGDTANTTKAFGYLRVSTEGQIDGDGFTRQREAITKWADSHGIVITRWFEERGVSGTLAERPELSKMMVALMCNGTSLVVVEKLDRIARDQMVQETIIQSLLKAGFELRSAHNGEQDLCGNDPGRKLMRTIMGGIAEYDKQMVVLKLRTARERKRAKGRCEGRKPFGHYPGESETAARILTLYATLQNYEHVAKALNAEGFQTRGTKKRRGEWCAAGVRRVVLQNQNQKEAA